MPRPTLCLPGPGSSEEVVLFLQGLCIPAFLHRQVKVKSTRSVSLRLSVAAFPSSNVAHPALSSMNTTSSQDISKPSSVFNGSSTIPVWLDGVQVVLGSTFDVVSPVDGSTLYQASSANEEDVLRAVHSAEASFKTWSKSKPNFRRDIFLRASELFLNRRKELQQYSMTETGTVEAIFSRDLEMAADACKSIAGLIQVASSSSSPVVAEEGSSSIIYKEPYGVVLGIAPWNAPYVLGVRACLQPLAM